MRRCSYLRHTGLLDSRKLGLLGLKSWRVGLLSELRLARSRSAPYRQELTNWLTRVAFEHEHTSAARARREPSATVIRELALLLT